MLDRGGECSQRPPGSNQRRAEGSSSSSLSSDKIAFGGLSSGMMDNVDSVLRIMRRYKKRGGGRQRRLGEDRHGGRDGDGVGSVNRLGYSQC